MSTGTAKQKQVTEVRFEGDAEGEPEPAISVEVGSEIRVVFSAVSGIGPHNYEVKASGSIGSGGQETVAEFVNGKMQIGELRTDVVLSAKSIGKGDVKVRTLDESGVEHATRVVSFNIVAAGDDA